MSSIPDVLRSGIKSEDLTELPPEIRTGLEPLLRFINLSTQGLVSALSGNLTLSSNVDTEVQTVPLSHGVAQLISLKKLQKAYGVIAISVGSPDSKTQHLLAQPLHLIGTTVPNQVKVIAYFADTTAVRVPVTLLLTPEGNYTALTPSTGVWTAPTLLNSYTAPRAVGYFRDSLGFIHLRGTVTGGVADTIFVLPAGYRPSALWIFSTDHNGAFGRIVVNTNGNVDSDLGLHTNAVLDGITFDGRA